MAGGLCEDASREEGARPADGDGNRKFFAGAGGDAAVERPEEEGGTGAHRHDDLRACRQGGAAPCAAAACRAALHGAPRRACPRGDTGKTDGALPLYARLLREHRHLQRLRPAAR